MYNSLNMRVIKRNRRILVGSIISLIVFLVIILFIPNMILSKTDKNILKLVKSNNLGKIINKQINENKDDIDEKYTKFYNLIDLIKYYALESSENVIFTSKSDVDYIIDDEKYVVDVELTQRDENSTYMIEYGIGENRIQETLEDTKQIQFELNKEGKNDCHIEIKKDGNILDNGQWNKNIYKINSYQKQFLDNFSNKGVAVHYDGNSWGEKYEKSLKLLTAIGAKNIKTDLMYSNIAKSKGNYEFSYYDSWVNEVKKNDIKILFILNSFTNTIFSSNIDTDEEIEEYKNFFNSVIERYPFIEYYEVLNEPNYLYRNENEVKNYSKLVNASREVLEKNGKNASLISGCVANSPNTTAYTLAAMEFINYLTQNGGYKNSTGYSYHPYDKTNVAKQNPDFTKYLEKYRKALNSYGGFIRDYITEFGFYMDNKNNTERVQADKIIQQSVLTDSYNVDLSILYALWDSGTKIENAEHNFGIVFHDYTPKSSYYAMKNFYENTNGAEYLGTVNIADGLQFHVYDKDGVPKVIAWSDNADKDVTIQYKDFKAKNLYGDDIQADETSNLTITIEPVYLDNISRKYFYKAISNTIKEKVTEFETKFVDEISKANGLSEKLEQQKQIAEDIGTHNESNEIAENIAIQYMKDFYTIGNILIDEYKKGKLDVEDVKLSSMLDSLNDIGDFYEDLVTITAQTRNSNFEETNKKIEEAVNVINNGKDLNNIYPSKILDFAKEFNEKATYINSLEEENDIKTGLIVSKNLHANLLADWAKQFADVYIDKYLQENPVQEVTYKTEDGQEYKLENLTNKSVIATLPTTEDMQITSEGGNIHTFEQNDSFTFTYTRRGRNFEVVANVENIDKDAPIIRGVKNNKLYISQVSVDVEDKNLEDVKVICNDIEIKYTLNTPLNEEGIYEITATDKVGNTKKIVFQLIESASEIYIIGDKHISNIQGGTTAKELKEKLLSSVDYDIRRNNEILGDNEIIRTGDTIETKDMHQLYTLIVAGDVNKDGEINIRDLVRLRKYLLGQIELDELEIMSSDTNVDNKKISIKDFIRMSILILSK